MLNKFEQNFIVELCDITPDFGMKPTSVLKYYQETFARYCAKYNVAGYNLYEMGLKWVFGQTVVEYFNVIPIWNERVYSEIYISCVKKLRMYINFEVKTDRGVVAKGQSVAYTLDLETSRPKPIDDIASKFDLTQENKNGEIIKTNFDGIGELVNYKEHKITFSDLDYNGHTNNISYISLSLEGMPAEFLNKNRPKVMNIIYLQETFLNDNLRCEMYKKNDIYGCRIKNPKDNSDVCIINSTWQSNNMNPEEFFKILDVVRNNFVS